MSLLIRGYSGAQSDVEGLVGGQEGKERYSFDRFVSGYYSQWSHFGKREAWESGDW